MARDTPLLVRRFPRLAGALPHRVLVHAPTPVDPLSEAVAGRTNCFVKRDDRVSTLYGGNKVRRFEYLLADAEARGARTLVTVGGLASTQVMATAAFGRELGFRVAAVLFDQPLTAFARRALLTSHGLGAELVFGGSYAGTVARTASLLARAERPYFVAPGASGPRSILGYVDAAFELAAQVEAGEAPRPDRVLVASGSGGTAAGLALGFAILGWDTEVVAVRITEPIACNETILRFLAWRSAKLLERLAGARPSRRPKLRVDGRFLGRGYGHATPEAVRAAPLVREALGVLGEVTYTGKALAALRAHAVEAPRETLLFWATLSSTPLGSIADDQELERLATNERRECVPGFEASFEGALSDPILSLGRAQGIGG